MDSNVSISLNFNSSEKEAMDQSTHQELSTYERRPFYFPSRHLETIVPSVIFKIENPGFIRERLELIDGDFLDLDWIRQGSSKLIIISHGLEGSTERYYVRRSARYFKSLGFDILAWNNRSCSGVMNRLPKVYHHGQISDLIEVMDSIPQNLYQEIFLIGFSMGGSHTTKYLCSSKVPSCIQAGIAFSVSYDMEDSLNELHKPASKIYHDRFLEKLLSKAELIQNNHPKAITCDLSTIDSFKDYHRHVTLPINDFGTEDEFYFDASPKNFIQDLKKPLLMVNALNDPILGPKCYPEDDLVENLSVYKPKYGGHLGFNYSFTPGLSFMERISEEFITRFSTN